MVPSLSLELLPLKEQTRLVQLLVKAASGSALTASETVTFLVIDTESPRLSVTVSLTG